MLKRVIKESASVRHIREFVAHMCNKDFAKANACLSLAIQDKIKSRVQATLKESN